MDLELSPQLKALKVRNLAVDENILLNRGSTIVHGQVIGVDGNSAKIKLKSPVCASLEERFVVYRKDGEVSHNNYNNTIFM